MIGERLFPLVQREQPKLAGKITGMLLELENGELIALLASPVALNDKIQEAMQVLQAHLESTLDEEADRPKQPAVERGGEQATAGLLLVTNLSDDTDDDALLRAFAAFGVIAATRNIVGKSRACGFVTFLSPEEATKATAAMNGCMLDSKPVCITVEQKEKFRASLEERLVAITKLGLPNLSQGMLMGHTRADQDSFTPR